MADPRYGAGGAGFQDTLARMQQQAAAADELSRKEEQRQSVEERGVSAEASVVRSRSGAAAATRELSSALSANVSQLVSETAAVEANTAAWRANAIARQSAERGTVARGTGPRAAASAALVEDPGAQARYQAAIASQAQAELAATQARQGVTSAARSGVSAGELAPLVAQREAANQSLNQARAETRSAQASAQAQEQLAVQRRAAIAEQGRINEGLAQESGRQANVAALAAREQAAREASLADLRLSTAASPTLSSAAREHLAASQLQSSVAGLGTPAGRTVIGGPFTGRPAAPEPLGLAQTASVTQQEREAAQAAAQHEERLGALAARQREVNLAYNQSVASYAASSSALSRHGALTTEFIQAFARGQVTLKEFETQMLSTIGKFSGWAVAAGLVYGAAGALKDLGSGASQTQTGVAQLGRFIPGLGGPAGGGRDQIPAAESTLRDISTQFNVPIKEVVDSMTVMARVFHTVASAGDATRAVLAAVKLDQIPVQQAEQYLTGIGQSLNIQSGRGLEGVVSSLNALQNTLGARVAQTLPALARAAPAAQAGGLDTPTLEALVAIGVRAGITGPQVGTALLRSIGTFAFRPQSEQIFQQYGISAQQGQYGALIGDVSKLIDTRQRQGTPLSGNDLRNLAQALGGPLLGTRTLLPLLEQEQLHPGAIGRARDTAASPPSFQRDLDAVLSTVSERFKSLGIALQNFGSFLASSGVLSPLLAGFDVIGGVVHAMEALLSPLVSLAGVVNQLPAPMRDLLGALVAYRAGRALYNSSFGSNAQGFIGRLPGLDALDTQPRQVIRSTTGRLQTYALPVAQNEEEAADRQLMQARYRQATALDALTKYDEENAALARAPVGSAGRQAYDEGRESLVAQAQQADQKAAGAADRAAAAGEQVARISADIAVLRDRHYTTEQKSLYIAERGLAIDQEINDLQEARLAEMRSLVGTLGRTSGAQASVVAAGRGGGGGGVDPLTAATAAAGSTVVAAAAVKSLEAQQTAATGGRVFIGTPTGETSISTPPPGFVAAAGTSAAAAESGLLSQLGIASALQRARALPGQAADALSGGAGPFAGLIASQLVGQTVGGGVGNFISGVGGSAATGALLAQMLGRSSLGGAALGTIAGSFQQNSTSGIASAVGGAAGAGIGALLGFGVPGALVGGAIGSTLGSIAGGIFGGGDAPPSATDVARKADLAAQASNSQQDLTKFGDQFGSDLQSAFGGTGDAATKAQAKIGQQVRDLGSVLTVFGGQSAAGQQAIRQLQQVVTQGAGHLGLSPDKVSQIMQQAEQQLVQQADQRFKYLLATGAGGGALGAGTGYEQVLTALQEQQSQATADVQASSGVLTQAQLRGSASAIAAAQKQLSDARTAKQQADDAVARTREAQQLAYQAQVAQTVQVEQQRLGASTALAQSQAGGNKLAQLQVQISQQQQLQGIAQTPGLNPDQANNDFTNAQAKINDLRTQAVQQQLTELKSRQTVSAAAVPSYDTVGAAQQNLQDLAGQYNFIVAHRSAFDPSQVNDALAAVIKARTAVSQAAADFAIQMNDINGQIQAAVDVGDKVAAAADLVNASARGLSLARGPKAQAEARLKLINAQNAAYDAQSQAIQSAEGLAAAQDPSDPVGNAQRAISLAQVMLGRARGTTERVAALTQLAQAEDQYNQALVQRTKAETDYAASQTNDPVQKARIDLQGAQRELAQAKGPEATLQAATNVNNVKQQYAQALISQRQSTIDFQLNMQQITTQQAINQLQDLLKLRGVTLQERQSILQKIRALQTGNDTSGQFDLTPGNIKLPTPYDVRRAVAQARSALGASINPGSGLTAAGDLTHTSVGSIDAQTHIAVYVGKDADVVKVADALERATGSQLKARLRAAGIRGT